MTDRAARKKHVSLLACSLIMLIMFHSCGETPLRQTSGAGGDVRVRVGTTFSQVQCGYLGLDQEKTYLEITGMGFTVIRLGAYWKQIEKRADVFDFAELDWQIKKARQRRIPVVLTVGMKAPRWPEFFIPEWVMRDVYLKFGADASSSDYLKERTLKFITAVICRYRDDPAIRWWQVENEPLNRSGPKNWWIHRDFLKKEIDLVKRLDPMKRPVIVNIATYPNTLVRFFSQLNISNDPEAEAIELSDILAVNVYPVVGQQFWRLKLCFWTRPGQRRRYLQRIIQAARQENKSVWATELQAEPWEPGQLVHVGKKQPVTCLPETFRQSFEEMVSLGVDTILLWGVEYWIFRERRHNDDNWLEQGQEIIRRAEGTLSADQPRP